MVMVLIAWEKQSAVFQNDSLDLVRVDIRYFPYGQRFWTGLIAASHVVVFDIQRWG